jgi:hypothetical protein
MAFTLDLPETIPSSSRVEEPGTYHVVVTEVEEEPRDKSGALLEGFKVHFEVLDGTTRVNNVCSQRGFTHEHMFFTPRPSDSEGSIKWNRAKQAAILLATGLTSKEQLGKSVQVNLADMQQKQCVINLVRSNRDERYLEVAFANIYAVDDPKVAAVPKDVAALRLIGKEAAAAPAPTTAAAPAKPATKPAARSTPNPATTPDPNNANPARGQASTNPTTTVAASGDWKL